MPRGNNRVFSISTEWREADPYYWLTDKGIDIEADANAALLRLAEAAPGRPNPDGTHTASVTEGARALIALADVDSEFQATVTVADGHRPRADDAPTRV